LNSPNFPSGAQATATRNGVKALADTPKGVDGVNMVEAIEPTADRATMEIIEGAKLRRRVI
jgi:hypothetical protein